MILYRFMTQYAIDKGNEWCFFAPTHTFSTRQNGLRTINGKSCFNTFTPEQNKELHFFKFAIDAIQYMDDESFRWNGLYLGKFDIPDELLEKGFGFYMFSVRSEFIPKPNAILSSKYLINVISEHDNRSLHSEMRSDLDEAIYWHSTAGKAMTTIVNGGLNGNYICGDEFHGGFIRVYNRYLNRLLESRRLNITKDFIQECTEKNQAAYDNSTILTDKNYIREHFYKDYHEGLNYEEINKLFSGLEDYYINKTITSLEDIQYKDRSRKKE